MPPVNRKSPSPVRRRPVIAGARTAGTDRATATMPRPEPAPTPAARAKQAGPPQESAIRKPAAGTPRLRAVAFILAALVVVVAVALSAVSLLHAERSGNDADVASNVALLDAPATQEAGAAAVDILQKAYSYKYTTIDADFAGAMAMMTPEMLGQYRPLVDKIRDAATQAKTTTKATVVSDAVRLLDGDRAEVIAFVVVTGDNAGTALTPSGYRFTANLLRDNGKWLLSGLTES